jgi:hypothetical protein
MLEPSERLNPGWCPCLAVTIHRVWLPPCMGTTLRVT